MRVALPRPSATALAALLAGAFLGLAPARAAPVERLRLETLVPPTTLAFVALHEVAQLPDRLAATPLGRIVSDPDSAAFVTSFVDGARAVLARAADGGEPALSPELAAAVLRASDLDGDAAVALLRVPEDGTPRVAALLDFGPRLSRFVDFLRSMRAGWPRADADVHVTEGSDGTWVVEVSGRPRALGVLLLGTAVLVSDDDEWLRRVAAARGAPAEGALSDTTAWAAAFRRGPPTPLLRAFTDPQAFGVEAPGLAPDAPARRVAEALGLDGTVAVGFTVDVADGAFVERLSLACDETPRSPAAIVDEATTVPGAAAPLLARAPAGAVAIVQAGVQPGPALGVLWRTLSAADEDAADALVDALEAFRARTGVRLEAVLGALGPDVGAFAGLSDAGGVLPHVALVVEARPASGVEALLATAAAEAVAQNGPDEPVAVVTTPLRVHDAHGFDVRLVRPSPGPSFAPTGATVLLDGDRLLLAANAATLRDAVERGRGDAPTASLRPAVAAAFASTPTTLRARAWLDAGRVLASAYDTVVPVLQTVGDDRVGPFPVDWAALPPTRVVAAALRPTTATLRLEGAAPARELVLEVTGSVPLLTAALVVLVRRAGDLLEAPPSVGDVEPPSPHAAGSEADEEQRTELVLRRVEAALLEFAARYGALPARLDELVAPAGLLAVAPRDGWGRALVWRRALSAVGGTLESVGPDGRPGTDDDRGVEVAVPRK